MEDIYSFPGWAKLAEIPEGDLRLLKMGYRAKYISQSAKFINEQPGWLESIPHMKYTDAKNELLNFQE